MTTEQLTTTITNTSKRWNDILFAQANSYSDGIPNLSDIKLAYGRRNGENWLPNIAYNAGEIVSVKSNLYVSLINNNQGIEPGTIPAISKWNNISTNSLISGNFFAGAFCNFTIASNQIIISNNYNIDSITNISSAVFDTLDFSSFEFDVKLRESSNISGSTYLVFTNISTIKNDINTSLPNINANVKKSSDVVAFDKKSLSFRLGGEYMRNVMYSLMVVPGSQASTN